MQLPRLAMQCSLRDVMPNNDKSNWSEVNNDALDNCFNADKYECTFHSFNDDQYIISLNRDGQDVSTMLVQQNLAVFATKTSIETINGENYFKIFLFDALYMTLIIMHLVC